MVLLSSPRMMLVTYNLKNVNLFRFIFQLFLLFDVLGCLFQLLRMQSFSAVFSLVFDGGKKAFCFCLNYVQGNLIWLFKLLKIGVSGLTSTKFQISNILLTEWSELFNTETPLTCGRICLNNLNNKSRKYESGFQWGPKRLFLFSSRPLFLNYESE